MSNEDKSTSDLEKQAFDRVASNPEFHEPFRELMDLADAEIADEDAAIARGDLVWSPDGRLLPAGDPALVPGYTPPRPPTVAFIAHTRGVVLSLAVYPDHEKLVGCDGSRGIQVWDLRSGQELCRRENLPSPIDQLAVSPDGLRVVGIDRYGKVFAWDAQSLMPIVEAANLECYAPSLGLATKVRKQYFSVFTNSGVEIYEDGGKVCARWPNQGPVVVLLDKGKPECIKLAISDDGLYTAVMVNSMPDSLISVFETEHLLRAPEWADPDDPDSEAINSWGDEGILQEMDFSPDGQTIAVRWWEGNWVDIWDFRKDKTDAFGTYTHVPITALAFLGNKKVVVGRGNDIEVLDLELHAVET